LHKYKFDKESFWLLKGYKSTFSVHVTTLDKELHDIPIDTTEMNIF